MHRFLVPIAGLAVVATLAGTLIGVIVLRSPDTHGNLWVATRPDYLRTPLSFIGHEIEDSELELGMRERQERSAAAWAAERGDTPDDRGRAIYLSRGCATCHGLDATGGTVGPSLRGSSLEVVTRMVRAGRGGMPAYTEGHLRDIDLVELVLYLQGSKAASPDSEKIAALQRLAYDPGVPVAVLLKGKAAIRRSCGACHDQPGKEDILRAFSSDAEAAGLVAEMVQEANLGLEDAEAIARYMLAVRNGADPIQAPWTRQ